jgi:putative transposase
MSYTLDRDKIERVCSTIAVDVSDLNPKSDSNQNQYKPYWTKQSKKISNKMWIPNKIVPAKLKNDKSHKEDWNRYFKIFENADDDRLKGVLPKIKFPDLKSENLEPEKMQFKTIKIKFVPSKLQRHYLNIFIRGHRFMYNRAIDAIKTIYNNRKAEFEKSKTCVVCDRKKEEKSYTCARHKSEKLPWNLKINFISIKKVAMITNDYIKTHPKFKWLEIVPNNTRQFAIKDAVAAYDAAMTNKARGKISAFTMGFMSAKTTSKVAWFDKRTGFIDNGQFSLCPKLLKKNKSFFVSKKQSKSLPKSIDHDFKIQHSHGSWYLILTVPSELDQTKHNNEVIAFDPGVRTFQVGYSPTNNKVYLIGEEVSSKIEKIHKKLDRLQSIKDTIKTKKKSKRKPEIDIAQSKKNRNKRRRIKKKMNKLNLKRTNIVDDMHHQVSCYFARTFGTIILPSFGTQSMLKGNIMASKSKRQMSSLQHYKFQQRLKWKSSVYNSKLFIVEEDYTTRTCGQCGCVNNNVKSKKVFVCNDCGYQVHRDIHGARNVMIKTMTEHGTGY